MAVNPKTPGVYIEEIPVFPASIAGVATAVPAFMGYVEKAENNGIGIPINTPTRITSLLEYESIFGKGESQLFAIGINDILTPVPVQRVVTVIKGVESLFKLYYNIQMYFANGGGPCYIVPIGLYSGGSVTLSPMQAGLSAIAKVDEPTLLMFPDAISLSLANRKVIYDDALAQCEKLKDRFTIMDVTHNGTNTVFADASDFRNTTIGADNLKYGASYYPFLNTTLGFSLNENLLNISTQTTQNTSASPVVPVTDSATSIAFFNAIETLLFRVQQGFSNAKMEVVNLTNVSTGIGAITTAQTAFNAAISSAIAALKPAPFTAAVTIVNTDINTGNFKTATTAYNVGSPTGSPTRTEAAALIAAYNQLITEILDVRTIAYTTLNTATVPPLSTLIAGSLANLRNTNPALYNTITAQLTSYSLQLNPSGAMAGIYARVDNEISFFCCCTRKSTIAPDTC